MVAVTRRRVVCIHPWLHAVNVRVLVGMADEKRREIEEIAKNGEKQPSSPRDTNPYTFVHTDDEEPSTRYRRQAPDPDGRGRAPKMTTMIRRRRWPPDV